MSESTHAWMVRAGNNNELADDLVVCEYRLPVAEGETTVAVKIIDMLGEEVLVVGSV